MPKKKGNDCASFKSIEICYQNVRGLRSKTNTFYNNVTQNSFHFIALTFLMSSISDGELFPPNYQVTVGGVGFYLQ